MRFWDTLNKQQQLKSIAYWFTNLEYVKGKKDLHSLEVMREDVPCIRSSLLIMGYSDDEIDNIGPLMASTKPQMIEEWNESSIECFVPMRLHHCADYLFVELNNKYVFEDVRNARGFFDLWYKKVEMGGKTVIIFRDDPTDCRDISNFKALHENKKIKFVSKNAEGVETEKIKQATDYWLDYCDTYNDVGFYPNDTSKVQGRINLFKGFYKATEDMQKVEPILEFIKIVICADNDKYYQYVKAWIAQLLQYPGNKTAVGVALSLRGEKGVGKSFFANIIKVLVNQEHTITCNSPSDIAGDFNGHLHNKLLVIAEEAIWGGDKKELGKLKDFITSDNMIIKYKFKEAFKVKNYMRFMFLTNNDWTPGERGERRFFTLDVSPIHKKDTQYFKELQRILDSGGYEAISYYFQLYNIEDFDFQSNFVITNAMEESIERSLDSIESFIDNEFFHNDLCFGGQEQLESIYDNYISYCNKMKLYTLTKSSFSRKLKKVFPLMFTKREGKEQVRILFFPEKNKMIECWNHYLYG